MNAPDTLLLGRLGSRLGLALPVAGGDVRLHPLGSALAEPTPFVLEFEEAGSGEVRSFPFGGRGPVWPQLEVEERPAAVRMVGADAELGVLMWLEFIAPLSMTTPVLSSLPVLLLDVGVSIVGERTGVAGRIVLGTGEGRTGAVGAGFGLLSEGEIGPDRLYGSLPEGLLPPDRPTPWRTAWLPLSGKWLEEGGMLTHPLALNAGNDWDRVTATVALIASVEGSVAVQGGSRMELASRMAWPDLDAVAVAVAGNAARLRGAREAAGPIRAPAVHQALAQSWWLGDRILFTGAGHREVLDALSPGWMAAPIDVSLLGAPLLENDPSHRRRLW